MEYKNVLTNLIENFKKSVNTAVNEYALESGLHLEAKFFGKACATEDSKEGTQVFLEKRKANFRGK